MVETERAEESESSGETESGERPNMQNMGISLTTEWSLEQRWCRLLLRLMRSSEWDMTGISH